METKSSHERGGRKNQQEKKNTSRKTWNRLKLFSTTEMKLAEIDSN